MKNKKILLTLGLTIVSAVALTSCDKNKQIVDNSALSYDVTKNWFMAGQTQDEKVSNVFSKEIYDPTLSEGFDKNSSYFTVYAQDNLSVSLRMVETEISSSNFNDRVKNDVLYLQTSSFNDSYKQKIAEKVSLKKDEIVSALGFEANVQTAFKKSFAEYNITKDMIKDNTQNYLEVVYLPLFIRSYSSYSEDNSTLNLASFVAVPVYVCVTDKNDNKYTNEIADSFKDKIVKFDYDSSSQIIR